MNEAIHIVSLDAPAPPDYGGAIDMFYKIKALHDTGQKPILHYFDYQPGRNADALKEFCTAMYAYKRKSIWQTPPHSRPFIIQSRINDELIHHLNSDNHPVLLEGLHCAGIVPFLKNKERVVIRMHNEEAAYYRHLAKTEQMPWKRSYFLRESRLLKQYQKTMDKDIRLACLSETDRDVLKAEFGFRRAFFVPCFLPWQKLSGLEGKGGYCLYHGNLAVPENNEAALWLTKNIFSKIAIPFVVAGKQVSKSLKAAAINHPSISFVNNPSIAEIDRLVQNAHINVLPSLNNTGVKLKLLNALFNGRHCITNRNGIHGSRIGKGVLVKETVEEWIRAIEGLLGKEFSAGDKEERKNMLALYNNNANAETLSAEWLHCR